MPSPISARTLLLSIFLLASFSPLSHSFIPESYTKTDDSIPYPVIGLLTMPSPFASAGYPSNEFSYLAASYVKHLESAGAVIVPIQWDTPFDELDVLLGKINGVLFPGGGSSLVNKTDWTPTLFLQTGMHIVNKALEFNRNGDYFPVWGTCLGFEMLTLSISTNMSLLVSIVDGNDIAKVLNVTDEGRGGMFADMDSDLLNKIQTSNLSYFHHSWTPDPNAWTNDTNLASNFTVSSWTVDSGAGLYAAGIQGTAHPFMGTQFHPEKNTFEWYLPTQIPHTLDAVLAEEYYAYFFVNMTLKNGHKFTSAQDLEQSSVYNYKAKHFGPNPEFEQVYVFRNYQTYDPHLELVDEYPKGFGPVKQETKPAVEVPQADVGYKFMEAAPFLFTKEAEAKWH